MAQLTKGGKILLLVLGIGVIAGGIKAYDAFVPKNAKDVKVTTKATNLPPLAYDKNSNAKFRELPDYGNQVEVANSPVIRGHLMEWYSQTGQLYAVGGKSTTKGSLAEELGLNIQLDVQNNCSKQAEDLYMFAQDLHSGNANPTKGAHYIAWMGDGVPSYLSSLNQRLKDDFGDEYQAKVMMFGGSSNGEDKWLVKKKFAKDARGSLTVTVIRDGDWNICVMKSQLMGWEINYQDGTYDKNKVNFIAAPNDDYLEATKLYVAGQKVKLKFIENGKLTGKDTNILVSGVSTWFPGDYNAVKEKSGLVSIASTKDFSSQMANAIIFIDKWAKDNPEIMTKFCAIVGVGGDQVKSHQSALEYGVKVGKEVFQSSMSEEDILKAYASFDVTDDEDNVVNVGGSRVFNLSDAATYTGIVGGQDKYKSVYTTFGDIATQAYPEVIKSYPSYEDATDWTYLRAAYTKYKSQAGNTSKTDFKATTKSTQIVGDASYSIEFNTGSSTIKSSSFPILDKILAQLQIADNLFVDLGGHTDNTGNPSSNKELSQARAQAVADYLTAKDEELTNRLTVKGFGEEKPIADNSTLAGKAKNRRVEVKLLRTN